MNLPVITTTISKRGRLGNLLLAISVLFLGGGPWVSAQDTFTWDAGGGGTTTWSTNTNWAGDVVPTFDAGDIFDLSTLNILAASVSTMNTANTLGVIRIGDATTSHAWNLGGSGVLTLDYLAAPAEINQSASSIGDTISITSVVLNTDLTINNASTNTTNNRVLTISSGISANTAGNKVITSGGSTVGNVTLSGAITNGLGTVSIVKNNASNTLTLSGGVSNFTGGVTLNAGTLLLNKASALGATAGTLTITGGTLGTGNSGGQTLTTNNAQSWDGNFSLAGSGNLSMGTGIITFNANRTVTLSGAASTTPLTYTLGGVLNGGSSRLTFESATSANNLTGIVNITAAPTYTGGTTINGGLIRFTSIPATGVITIGVRGALAASGTYTALSDWMNSAVLDEASSGSLALAGNSAENFSNATYTTLSLGATSGTTAVYTGALTPSATAYYVGGGGGTISFGTTASNVFTGSRIVNVGRGGGGTVILNSSNDYTGVTSVVGGILTIRNGGALGTTAGGAVVSAAAAIHLENNVTVTGETLSVTGVSSGAMNNAALRNVSGSNEWTGNITFTGTSENVRFNLAGGSLLVSGNVAITGSSSSFTGLVLTGDGVTGNGTISGQLTGSNITLTKNGNSTWVLSSASGTRNNFTGVTRIDAGVLSMDSITQLGASSTADINIGLAATTGTLRYTGTAALETTNRRLFMRSEDTTGSAGGAIIEQSGTGVIDFAAGASSSGLGASKALTLRGSTAGTGVISGNVTGGNTRLVKDGTGTWTLSGAANTYAGTTTVSGGTLLVNGTHTGAGSYTINTAGAKIGGGGSVTGASSATITLGATSFLMVGNTHGAGATNQLAGVDFDLTTVTGGAISLTGTMQFDVFTGIADNDRLDLAMAAGGTPILSNGMVELAIGEGTDTSGWLAEGRTWQLINWNGLTASTGGLGLTAGTIAAFESAGFTLTQSIINDGAGSGVDGFYVTIGAVPEPSRILLVLAGLSIACLRRRRK